MIRLPHRFPLRRLASLLLLLPLAAQAGSHAPANGGGFAPDRVAAFGKQVERYAASRRAQVFIIGRQGVPADQLPPGVELTHTGIGIYSSISSAQGKTLKGYAIHNLYQTHEGGDQSHLAMDYPIDFFSGVAELKAGILIPTPTLQAKLLASFEKGYHTRLHNSDYSLVSNPFTTRYQNCTEHTLDIIFASLYATDDPSRIKAHQKAYFTPQKIRFSSTERWFGPWVRQDFKIDDHPGPVHTTTFNAIEGFLEQYGLLQEAALLTPAPQVH